jgi:hypothetical protein
VSSYAPFFEIDPHWHDDGRFREPAGFEATCRRMFNTHLLFDMLPQATNARYPLATPAAAPQSAIHNTNGSWCVRILHICLYYIYYTAALL